jgi:hypothetical protein
MGDEDHGQYLPQRVRGAARGGSAPPTAPVLSEEMRKRIQAAVRAERAGTTAEDTEPSTEPRRGTAAESARAVMSPVGEKIKRANGGHKRHVKPEHAAKSEHSGKREPDAKDEPVVEPESPVRPAHAVKPEPALKSRSNGKVPAHHEPADAVQAEPVPPEEGAWPVPDDRLFGWVRVAAFFLVLVAVGSLATAVSVYFANSASGNGAAGAAALQRQEVQTRAEAASWVAQQVNRDDVVSCDQPMCTALRAAGFPAGKLLVLEPTSNPPVTSAVVVVTAAVRSMFGSSIDAAWAPDVLATIGSGAEEITIRLIAPNGALAYQSALGSGMAFRKNFGAALLSSNKIELSQVAQNQLNAGQVDPRLVLAIASLAYDEPIDVARFENIGPGVSTNLPLRFADLTVNGNPANMTSSAYIRALHAYLSSQSGQLGPVSGQPALSGGQDVFRVEFAAPSPLASINATVSP